MTRRFTRLAAVALAALALTGAVVAVAAEGRSGKPTPYPLDTCIVSGEKLGSMGAPVVLVHEGQEFKLCCKECVKDFNKDPRKYQLALVDTVKERQRAGYPLDTCVVSGEKLGSMGAPVEFVHEGRLVRLCCKSCIKDFRENPAAFIAKLDAAAATRKDAKKN